MTAAQERRGGYAGTRERCDGGAGAAQLRHDPSLGCKVRAELLTEHGTIMARRSWCSYALPYFASREALRAEAGGRSCAM